MEYTIPIFMHQFQSKQDICDEFSVPPATLDACNILLAYYHVGDYGCDSSAFVLYEKGGVLYEVNADHCSCYGLEGQWGPEETNIAALDHRATHGSLGNVGGYDDSGYAAESRAVIEYLKTNFNPEN
ncbi:hypothetical protein D3C75_768460 [compost metagenome]